MNLRHYRFIGDRGFCDFSVEKSREMVVSALGEVTQSCCLQYREGYGGLVFHWVPYIGGPEKDYLGQVVGGTLHLSSTREIRSEWIRRPRVIPSVVHGLVLTKFRYSLWRTQKAFGIDDASDWIEPAQVKFLQMMWGRPEYFWPRELWVCGRYLKNLKRTRQGMVDNRNWSSCDEKKKEWGEQVVFIDQKIEEITDKWFDIWGKWKDSGTIKLGRLASNLLD